jgi:hypothetical protein
MTRLPSCTSPAYGSPFESKRVKNIHAAWELGCEVATLGAMPVVPHMNTAQMDDLQPQPWWLEATLVLMRRCNAVIFTPDYERSKGALGEEAEAKRLGLPCFYSVGELAQWLKPDGRTLADIFWSETTELWPGPGV